MSTSFSRFIVKSDLSVPSSPPEPQQKASESRELRAAVSVPHPAQALIDKLGDRFFKKEENTNG